MNKVCHMLRRIWLLLAVSDLMEFPAVVASEFAVESPTNGLAAGMAPPMPVAPAVAPVGRWVGSTVPPTAAAGAARRRRAIAVRNDTFCRAGWRAKVKRA